VIIRRATLEDAPALARVHVQTWLETYAGLLPQGVLDSISVEARRQQWEQAFARENHVLVVELGDAVVGFASVGQPRDEGVDVELFTLYLLKAHQGQGWGRALWDAALEAARTRGARTLGLWVLESNPTRGFYERQGGVLGERKTELIRGAPVNEVYYRYTL
jgi:ribosomal protein S18 acetylase RimI-like enzyme